MKHSLMRSIGIAVVLVALLTGSLYTLAQTSDSPITVIGSGIAGPLFQAAAAEAGVTAELNVTGTNTGFAQFCAGEADVTTAARPMSANENAACIENSVAYVELVIGHDAAAFVSSPETDFLTCLTQDQLNTIFAPSVQESVSNWNQVIADGPDQALTVYAPSDGTSTYAILDRVVEGDGVRADAEVLASGAEIAAAVAAAPGSVGVLSLPDAQAAAASVKILEVDTGAGCYAPDAQAIEGGLYAPADTLFVYASLASLQKPGLQDALLFATGSDAAQIVADQGFLPPTDSAVATNQQNLVAAESGETVARAVSDAAIATDLSGQLAIGGASSARGFIQATVDSFQTPPRRASWANQRGSASSATARLMFWPLTTTPHPNRPITAPPTPSSRLLCSLGGRRRCWLPTAAAITCHA
jgi:phosphate transport system substrate-binding protein